MEQSLYSVSPDRRIFVKGIGLVGVGLFLSTLGGCESLAEAIAKRPVRRRLFDGSSEIDGILDLYAAAVEAMRALDPSDPRSWESQYGIHGTLPSPGMPDRFNFCQHGTDHFFSWHRVYLAYFEQICQELLGDESFGLPYWNWNQDPTMHAKFTSSSTLSHGRNTTTVGGGPFSDTTFNTILGDTNFFSFSNQVEGQPHNNAHVQIGQDMVTGGSPNDPVFWVHHCMVDYCWYKWNVELENDNPSDSSWTGETWSHFVDGKGDPAEMTAGASVLLPLLWYRYESSALGSSPAMAASEALADADAVERRLRAGAEVSFDVRRRFPILEVAELAPLGSISRGTDITPDALASLVENRREDEQVFASIDYAENPTANDFLVRVFVNLPEANARTPIDSPHFAGTFTFFGTTMPGGHGGGGHGGGAHASHQPRFLVNVTDTLRRLRSIGAADASRPLSVQLVAVPVSGQEAIRAEPLKLTRIELLTTPVRARVR